MAVCRAGSCGAEILWVKTRSGAMIPLDSEPNPGGNVVLETDGKCYVLPNESAKTYTGDRYLPHWVSCTEPKMFRKPPRKVDVTSTVV